MHIITAKRLKDFWEHHPDAESALRSWILMLSRKNYLNHNQLKIDFPTVSILDNRKVVFNIGGNKYRRVVDMRYDMKKVFVRHIGSHTEYNEWIKKRIL